MALRAFSISILLIFSAAGYGQSLSLAIHDFNWQGNELSVSKGTMADSAASLEDGVSFHPTDPLVYYVKASSRGWDLISFNFETDERTVICHAQERLSHPRLTPDKKHVSCLVGGKRALQKYTFSTRQWSSVYRETSLENYLWMDENSLLIIVQGDPSELQLITLRPKKNVPVAMHVGRELHQTKELFAFVHKLSVDSWSIKGIYPDGSIRIISETLPEADRFSLFPGGKILMVSEDQIFAYLPASGWNQHPLEASYHDAKIKSIGVNVSGDKLFVLFATP